MGRDGGVDIGFSPVEASAEFHRSGQAAQVYIAVDGSAATTAEFGLKITEGEIPHSNLKIDLARFSHRTTRRTLGRGGINLRHFGRDNNSGSSSARGGISSTPGEISEQFTHHTNGRHQCFIRKRKTAWMTYKTQVPRNFDLRVENVLKRNNSC